MDAKVLFVRSATDRTVPRDLFVPEPRPFRRPQKCHRLRLATVDQAERAHRAGLPLYVLRPSTVSMLGYPIRFSPVLFATEPTLSGIDTPFRKVLSATAESVRDPRLEDVITMLLQIDELAARAVAERNQVEVRPSYLLKRILQANLEMAATLVRLQDFIPTLDRVGRSLPKAMIERQMRKNVPRGVFT